MISGSRFSTTAEVARQQRLAAQISQLQIDISTGVKVHVASDAPASASRIGQIRVAQADQAVWATNVTRATSIFEQADTAMEGMETSMVRAKELMISANTGTVSDSDRAAIATELQGIRDDIAAASQATDSNGNAIFTKTGTPLAIPVGRNLSVTANESYDDVFGNVTLGDGSTSSLDAILADAISAVQSNDKTRMGNALNAVGAADTHVTQARSDAGVRGTRLNALADRFDATKIDLEDERGGLEDTDITAASAELVQKKTILDAAQAVLAKLGQTSLFDKL